MCTASAVPAVRSAKGDAATILAPEEESKLDAIEKFIDQLIPQRRLEGFNYLHEPRIRESASSKPPPPSEFGQRRRRR